MPSAPRPKSCSTGRVVRSRRWRARWPTGSAILIRSRRSWWARPFGAIQGNVRARAAAHLMATFDPAFIPEDVLGVCKRLHGAGHAAYLVGGGIRDALLGRQAADFDVATSARPEA